jgi:GR25 family glycosyltransferase involved in LPS biosynthesis
MSSLEPSLHGFYINLDRSVERRRAFEAQIAACGLPYPVERFPAIDGQARGGCPAGLAAAEYGVWLSHIEILRRSVDGAHHLHVMEDDVQLSDRLPLLSHFIANLDATTQGAWDLLYLDATLVEIADMYQMFEWTQLARGKDTVYVCAMPSAFTVYGAMSYVVNARAKRRVLDFLERQLPAGQAFDSVLAYGIQSAELRAFVTAPFVTSSSELQLAGTVQEYDDEKLLAFHLFRKLCFGGLSDRALDEVELALSPIRARTGRAAALLGALMAYRMDRWPGQRFYAGERRIATPT